MRVILFSLAGVVAFACYSSHASAAAQAAPSVHATITGAWQLNHDASDRPGQFGPGPRGSGGSGGRGGTGGGGRRGGGGFGGRGRGGFGGGGMRGGGDRDESRRAMMEALRDLMTPPSRVTIVEGDGTVSFTDADGQVLKLAVNGKKEKHVVGAAELETKTKWDADNLVVEIGGKNGLKLVRTYSIVSSETARQLHVLTKIEGGRGGDREVKFVYDPVS